MTPANTAAPPARRPRRRFALIVLGLVLLVGGGAFVGSLVYRNMANKRLLREAIAEVEAADPHWRLETIEARRAVVPDEENSANIIRRARALLGAANSVAPVLGEHENGDLSPAIRLTDEQYRDVTEALIAAGASVEAALALADYPRGRSPINYPPNDLSTFPPHLDDIVFVNSCVLQPLLLARIHTGDGMGALRVCRAILNLGRSIGDEPLWRSQRLRQLRHGEAVRGLERLLGQCDMTEAELAAFVPALAEETEHDAWETIWRGERAVTFQVLEAVRQGQLKPRAIRAVRPVTTTTTIDNVQDWFRDRFPPDTRPSAAWALRRYSRLLEMAKLPWPQRRAAVNALAAELAGAPDLAGDFFIEVPAIAVSCQSTQALGRCAVVAVAVERYRLRHGAWPDALAVLVPELLPAVPTDPFDGQPLRYRRTADGVVFYSVGTDGTDDSGKLANVSPLWGGTDLGVRLWDVPHRRQAPRAGDGGDR
jgi:hypothetical protein